MLLWKIALLPRTAMVKCGGPFFIWVWWTCFHMSVVALFSYECGGPVFMWVWWHCLHVNCRMSAITLRPDDDIRGLYSVDHQTLIFHHSCTSFFSLSLTPFLYLSLPLCRSPYPYGYITMISIVEVLCCNKHYCVCSNDFLDTSFIHSEANFLVFQNF